MFSGKHAFNKCQSAAKDAIDSDVTGLIELTNLSAVILEPKVM